MFCKWHLSGVTNCEFKAIHISDFDKKVIAIFKKSRYKFVTTCQLTDTEDTELKSDW